MDNFNQKILKKFENAYDLVVNNSNKLKKLPNNVSLDDIQQLYDWTNQHYLDDAKTNNDMKDLFWGYADSLFNDQYDEDQIDDLANAAFDIFKKCK